LGGPYGGRVTHGVGDPIELAAVVAVGDPHGLAVAEAGGGGEAHRVRCVCLRILQAKGAGVNLPRRSQRRRCRSIRQSAKELTPLISATAAAVASLRVAAWIVRISDSMPSSPIQVASKRKVLVAVAGMVRSVGLLWNSTGWGVDRSTPWRSEANCPVRIGEAVDPGTPGAVAAHTEKVVTLALLNHNHGVACHLIRQAVLRLAADRGQGHGHRIGCG